MFQISLKKQLVANILPREKYLVFLNSCTWCGKSNMKASVCLNRGLSASNKERVAIMTQKVFTEKLWLKFLAISVAIKRYNFLCINFK